VIVKLDINRFKKNNEIWEVFTVHPSLKYLHESNRAIYFELWRQRNLHSIHNLYRLLYIHELKDKIVYIYEFDASIPPPQLNETISIEYFPVLGTKKCSTCYNEIIIQNKSYCTKRGNMNEKYSYYKCLYWAEKSLNTKNWGHHGHIFRQEATEGDGTSDLRISRRL
jgi:hypothetical protein